MLRCPRLYTAQITPYRKLKLDLHRTKIALRTKYNIKKIKQKLNQHRVCTVDVHERVFACLLLVSQFRET